MNEVSYTTNSNLNLFIIVKQLRQGWELGGNDEEIWIEEDGYTFMLDGNVMTPKGVI